jgi:hypothetical protein
MPYDYRAKTSKFQKFMYFRLLFEIKENRIKRKKA